LAASLAKDIKYWEKEGVSDIYTKHEATLSDHDNKVKALNKQYTESIQKLKKIKEHAESITGPITESLKKIFSEYPSTREELLSRIESYERAVQGIFEDAGVLAQFKKRQESIKKLSMEIDKEKDTMEEAEFKLNHNIEAWQKPVQDTVEMINKSFSSFFNNLREAGYHVAGQVELVHEGNDLSTYGIGIKVKFREHDELLRLQKEHHSGGERAITTFLYLLSLQEHATCAFRVVDEINQGMDNDKERLAFYRMVHQTEKPGSPQYFYITPKLLRRLEYPSTAIVHHVFNGLYSLKQNEWNLNHFLEAKRNNNKNNKRTINGTPIGTATTTTTAATANLNNVSSNAPSPDENDITRVSGGGRDVKRIR
jgi:chromosome segregation ATPase